MNKLAALYLQNNKELKVLSCHDNLLTALDLETNTLLSSLSSSPQNITTSEVDGSVFPYTFKFEVLSLDEKQIESILELNAYDSKGKFDCEFDNSIISFDLWPSKFVYKYDTGYSDSTMEVNISVLGSASTGPSVIYDWISITSPDSKAITLNSNGGSFDNVVISAADEYTKIIFCEITADSGVTVSFNTTSNDIKISGSVPANSGQAESSYSVNINVQGYRMAGSREAFNEQESFKIYVEPGRVEEPEPNSKEYMNNFTMSSNVESGIKSAFNTSNVYQFSDNEILEESSTVSDSDLARIRNNGQTVVINLPRIKANKNGVYVVKISLSGFDTNKRLSLQGVTQDAQAINSMTASELSNLDYKFFDENGNEITTVPESKNVYVAMVLSSGETNRSVITAGGLPVAFIEIIPPGELSSEVFDNIAANFISEDPDITSADIKLLPESAIGDPIEPTEAMLDYVKNEKYTLKYKLNTISVDESGYYVFKINVPEDLVSKDVKNIKVFVMSDSVEAAFRKSSFFGSMFTLLSGNGSKLFDGMSMPSQILVAGFLPMGESFFVGIGEILLKMLALLAGCEVGFGIAGGSLLLVGGLAVIKFFRRKK